MKYFDSRTVIILAVAIAVIGFFFSSGYIPRGSILDATHGSIYLNSPCPTPAFTRDQNDVPAPPPGFTLDKPPAVPKWPACGLIIPYRWLLAACVLAIAGALITRGKKSN